MLWVVEDEQRMSRVVSLSLSLIHSRREPFG